MVAVLHALAVMVNYAVLRSFVKTDFMFHFGSRALV